jgi:prepilin-type N-terminal cleavage/methylation domain-containing protein
MVDMYSASLRRGFTLIELLVVISIISILSAIIYANFGDAREDTKNKALLAEIKNTQLAIELYRAQNGQYPPVQEQASHPGCGLATDTAFNGDTASSSGSDACWLGIRHPYINQVVPDFIADLPSHTDSAMDNCEITYEVQHPEAAWYKLTAENCYAADSASKGIAKTDEMARCPTNCDTAALDDCGGNNYDPSDPEFYNSFAVYSAGGQCE